MPIIENSLPPTSTTLNALIRHDRDYWPADGTLIGTDEVGRGPLAGPVVACAVSLDFKGLQGPEWRWLNDSKKVTPARREKLAAVIRQQAAVSLVTIDVDDIDRLNILVASREAICQAALALAHNTPAPHRVLIDGFPFPIQGCETIGIVKGDAKSASIAAASIVAKVDRDARMVQFDSEFPGYGFAKHKGYATKQHLAALSQLGPSPIHRKSFAPVRKAAD